MLLVKKKILALESSSWITNGSSTSNNQFDGLNMRVEGTEPTALDNLP